MRKGYFHRVTEQTNNRLWINNPTPDEAVKSIEAGAISCTTNPSYVMKQLMEGSEHDRIITIIDETIKSVDDDKKAAALIQRKAVCRIIDIFLPLYENKPGVEGFVSIQGDPHAEENPDSIINEALEDMKLRKNVIAKIPVTEAGLKAIEYLVGKDVPIVATEVMGVAQAVRVCETYKRVSKETGKTPALYVTHISGIFDDHIKQVVESDNIDISKDALHQAGCIIARKQYKIMKERNYTGIMMGGGARGLHHFTEMVGSDVHVTINWRGTADKLIESDPAIINRMDVEASSHIVDELLYKIPDFKKAYYEDGLDVSEFKDYGPVVLFRNSFIKGWDYMLNIIKERRKILADK